METKIEENQKPERKESKLWKFLKALIPQQPMGREAWAYIESHQSLRDRLSPDERLASIRAEMRYNGVLRGYF